MRYVSDFLGRMDAISKRGAPQAECSKFLPASKLILEVAERHAIREYKDHDTHLTMWARARILRVIFGGETGGGLAIGIRACEPSNSLDSLPPFSKNCGEEMPDMNHPRPDI